MSFKVCAIIPSRNHHAVIGEILRHLREAGLPVFLIDDASDPPTRAVLAALHAPEAGATLFRFERNQGKGGAVLKGFELAAAAGFTHAIQIDADGQHDLMALPAMLAAGAAHPEAVILGTPVYDHSVPLGRRIGRWITHFWVGVETLSPRVIDSMCGFRLYPLAPVTALLQRARIGRHMEFDTDILVRLIWRGVPILRLPVRVTYPEANTSNFDMWRDNLRLTRMHVRLVLIMLAHLPRSLRHRPKPIETARHWSGMAERGAYWGLRFLALAYRLAGNRGCRIILPPIALYFLLTGTEQRRASLAFLRRAFAAQGLNREPDWRDSFRHFTNFAQKAVDTFAGWIGGLDPDAVELVDPAELQRVAASGRGLILIVSHLGNIDLSRATLDSELRARLTVLVHTRHAENYAKLLQRFRPEAALNTLQVTDTNPGTIVAMQDAIERGGWIAIAGDRTPVEGDRVSPAPFLGANAPFPQGPYVLAHLLECPVYLMFCLRERNRYRVYFEPFSERIALPRRGKEQALAQLASRYAQRLEHYALRDPFQWYNFFDFWAARSQPAEMEAS